MARTWKQKAALQRNRVGNPSLAEQHLAPTSRQKGGPITRARIENALDILAGIIATSNDADVTQLAPMYDRLERELTIIDDIRARAAVRLAAKEQT